MLAVVDRARRSVAEGLVHPHLEPSDGRWHALWGATLDEVVTDELDRIAAAAPAVSADPFDGDPDGFVHDLYACAVDELARRAVRAAGVRPTSGVRESGASERLIGGLLSDEPGLPSHGGYAALERRLSAWVDGGLARRSRAPWNVGLRLSEGDGGTVGVALWLEAADDPTLALPASLLRDGDEEVFAFLREGDPRGAVERRVASIDPVLEGAGLPRLDADEPEAVLDDDQVRALLREAMPRLEELGVPVLLPREWVSSQSRVRVNLVATAPGRSSGLLSRDVLARFDWRIAIGDVELTEEELTELAAAKEPLVRLRGRWHALRAPRSSGRSASSTPAGATPLSSISRERSRASRPTRRGSSSAASRSTTRSPSSSTATSAAISPARRRRACAHDLFPFQERGHGWLRLLGDLGAGGILADEMGLGKTVQAIAMLVSEREDGVALGPHARRRADERHPPVGARARPVRARSRRPCASRPGSALRPCVRRACRGDRRRDHLVRRRRTRPRDIRAHRLGPADPGRGAGREEPRDEAPPRAPANPAAPGAGAHRDAHRELARRALGDHGPRQPRSARLATGVRAHVRRPIEAGRDARALERLRSLVGPFLLRRAKDAPEVELELPPITIAKQPCLLTVEQASLYRATVDRWMPRIEEHERQLRPARRGARHARAAQAGVQSPGARPPVGRPLEGRSGKLERLVELLRAVPDDDRSLVFTQYPGFGRLAPHLAERLGVEVGFFHGGLTARARDDLVARFESGTGPEILVVSLRAGGRGLNLPAANHVFHFDRWWNPAVEQQATDRVHRFGQRKHVYVTSFVCTATVEERIDQLLDAKRELAEQVISGRADDWLAELDLDTLRAAVALAPEAIEEAA